MAAMLDSLRSALDGQIVRELAFCFAGFAWHWRGRAKPLTLDHSAHCDTGLRWPEARRAAHAPDHGRDRRASIGRYSLRSSMQIIAFVAGFVAQSVQLMMLVFAGGLLGALLVRIVLAKLFAHGRPSCRLGRTSTDIRSPGCSRSTEIRRPSRTQ